MTSKNSNVKELFDSLSSWDALEKLITEGEYENQFLECKGPIAIEYLTKDFKLDIAKEVSGFSNSDGGIIIFGASTTSKRGHDVITQLEPIGLINEFIKRLRISIPLMVTPNMVSILKDIKRNKTDTRGVALMYIPKTNSDPIKNIIDSKFYIRTGDQINEMPYEVLKRMFLGTSESDLHLNIDQKLIKKNLQEWDIPIYINNSSSKPAKNITVSILIKNPDQCEKITIDDFSDVSNINPGKKIFMKELNGIIYKGLNIVITRVHVSMKDKKRKLEFDANIFCENMVAKKINHVIYLTSKGKFKHKSSKEEFMF